MALASHSISHRLPHSQSESRRSASRPLPRSPGVSNRIPSVTLSEILEVDAENPLCHGIAPSKGGRGCTKRTLAANRAHARVLLQEGTARLQNGEPVDHLLMPIATRLICKTHQDDQAPGMVSGWKEEISAHRREWIQTQLFKVLEEYLAQAQRPTSARSPRNVRSTPQQSHPYSRRDGHRNFEQAANATDTSNEDDEDTDTSADTEFRQNRSGHLVRRKPVTGDCSICMLPFRVSEEGTGIRTIRTAPGLDNSDLVWCKSQCGGNLHKRCFDQWQTACLRGTRNVTCPLCRGQWEE